MSFLIVLNSDTSTRLGVSLLDRGGEKGKNRTTVASHLPYGIAILVSAYIFKEGQSVHLLPGKVFEVSCVCHIRKVIIDLTSVPSCLHRRHCKIFLPYTKQQWSSQIIYKVDCLIYRS